MTLDTLDAQAALNATAVARTTGPQPDAPADSGELGAIHADVTAAAQRIAPLWPLKSFVAVNPALGVTHLPFADAAGALSAALGARLVMPRAFYAQAIADGRITDADIEAAAVELNARGPVDAAAVKRALHQPTEPSTPMATFADVASAVTGRDWAGFAVDRISAWASGHFDVGQASWRSPWRHMRPYAAWREEAMIDRTPEVMGLAGFRAAVARAPKDPMAAILEACRRLEIPSEARATYLHRLLGTVAGWAGYARYLGWGQELRGETPPDVPEILAVRATWEAALQDSAPSPVLDVHWRAACGAMADQIDRGGPPLLDLILQRAYEISYRARTLEGLAARAAEPAAAAPARPSAQAVFCIDVRSERYRRALEAANPAIETVGFAGFFGAPIELAGPDAHAGDARCPVLLEPEFLVRALPDGEDDTAPRRAAARRTRERVAALWKGFATAAVSSFAFVEAAGLAFAAGLLRNTAKAAPTPKPGETALSIAPGHHHHRPAGLNPAERLALAEGALAGMGLTEGLARLVALVGHGATTTNNPYAAGLDCGACGGHSGEANARVAAMILNDPDVRADLAAKGKALPQDTVFVGALHDTTTDAVTVLDEAAIPESHAEDLAQLRRDLAEASRRAQRERAPTLGLSPEGGIDAAVKGRARDWSEVRPEWGLAGCAAFIAAPRARTRGVDLGGRAFLHSYDWRQDPDSAVLELIMTAPLVVASWISLQYYGSTVDNAVFGSGDKTLHNVVGGLGVLEGNAGDLRVGLPLQSVHDGRAFVHEPLRLTALIEAPIDAINAVLARHDGVRELFDHEWLHLIAIEDEGRAFKRYTRDLAWEAVNLGRDR